MKSIDLASASRPLSDYAKELAGQTLVLTRKRKPVAALVSLQHMDRETLAIGASPALERILDAARREIRSGKKLTYEEMGAAVLEPRPARRVRSARRR